MCLTQSLSSGVVTISKVDKAWGLANNFCRYPFRLSMTSGYVNLASQVLFLSSRIVWRPVSMLQSSQALGGRRAYNITSTAGVRTFAG
eukprot:jgi/Botrbrau1/23504/Bobra.106_1s0055.1